MKKKNKINKETSPPNAADGNDKESLSALEKKKQRSAAKIRLTIIFMLICFILLYLPVSIDQKIQSLHKQNLIFYNLKNIPQKYVGIVLGAAVWKKGPSPILKDRLDSAVQLYQNKKVKKILVSGGFDAEYYDEVFTMGKYLIKNGVRKNDIFLDHYGFRTYDTMYRAKHVFKVKDATIITQEFHLPRSIYIAQNHNINAIGFIANKKVYKDKLYNRSREFLARFKAWLDITLLKPIPNTKNIEIPVTGSSSKSWFR